MLDARAVGKQMFLEFAGELGDPGDQGEPGAPGELEKQRAFSGRAHSRWLRVHLGIYGAWDFAGEVRVDPGIEIHAPIRNQSILGRTRLGQTGMAGVGPVDRDGEDSVHSIGAPRRSRIRMAEADQFGGAAGSGPAAPQEITFPPEPVGQVRVRLLTDEVCADLRGPTACEVLTPAEVVAVIDRLGPDPANDASPAEMERFIARAGKKRTAIGLVLMDQSVIAGIGNVYRAEMLFRAGLDPHTPANTLKRGQLEALWQDWAALLEDGIRVGQMITIDGLRGKAYERALAERDERHWVYKLEGTPCKRCATNIALEEFGGRKLYWCPGCQT